jgi:hypothetical protein
MTDITGIDVVALIDKAKRLEADRDRLQADVVEYKGRLNLALGDILRMTGELERGAAEVEKYKQSEIKWAKELVQAGIDNDRLAAIGDELADLIPRTQAAMRWREARKQ